MAYKLVLTPLRSSYSVTDGAEVIRTDVAGGKPRYRRDIMGAASAVDVEWLVSRAEYDYLRAFYKSVVTEGSRWFFVDLILDEQTLTEHEAMFIPGSMALSNVAGGYCTVTAQLDVMPIERDYDIDSLYVALVGEFGLSEWERLCNEFHELVLDLP